MNILDLKITLGQLLIILLLAGGLCIAIIMMKKILESLKKVGPIYYLGAAFGMLIFIGAIISFPISKMAKQISLEQRESELIETILNHKNYVHFNSGDTLLIPGDGYAVVDFSKPIQFVDSDSYGISYKVGMDGSNIKKSMQYVTFAGGANNHQPKFSNIIVSLGDTTIQFTTNIVDSNGRFRYKF